MPYDQILAAGTEGFLANVTIRGTADGQPLTGLAVGDVAIKYIRDAALAVPMDLGSPGVLATIGTWQTDAWKETAEVGTYQYGVPNACLLAGATGVTIYFTCAGALVAKYRIILTAVNLQDAAYAGLSSLTTLLAKFAGITVLANWLKGLFRKDAMNAAAKLEVNAGGGAYDEATDSEEAQADALAAAIGFRVSAGQPTFSLAGASTQAFAVPQASHTDLVLIRDTLAGVPINISGKTVRMRVFDGTTVIMDLVSTEATEIVLTNPTVGVFTVHFTVALTATAGRFSYEIWDTTTPAAEVLWASGLFEILATHGPGE